MITFGGNIAEDYFRLQQPATYQFAMDGLPSFETWGTKGSFGFGFHVYPKSGRHARFDQIKMWARSLANYALDLGRGTAWNGYLVQVIPQNRHIEMTIG